MWLYVHYAPPHHTVTNHFRDGSLRRPRRRELRGDQNPEELGRCGADKEERRDLSQG